MRGEAPDSLLDTYESERLPHARAFIELAVRLGAVIQATDPAEIAARNQRFAEGSTTFDFPAPQLGPGYGHGTGPLIGALFPQPPLADGRLMDDVIGQRFAIVGEPALLEKLRPDAVLLPGVGQDWLAERGARAALLRPDRYIFAVAP